MDGQFLSEIKPEELKQTNLQIMWLYKCRSGHYEELEECPNGKYCFDSHGPPERRKPARTKGHAGNYRYEPSESNNEIERQFHPKSCKGSPSPLVIPLYLPSPSLNR